MSAPVAPEKNAGSQPVTAQPTEDQNPSNYVAGIADGNLATPMRLRDYLAGVGVVFRLHKRDRVAERRALAEEVAAMEAKRIRIPVRAILKVLAPIAAVAIAWTAYEKFSGAPLPQTVAGTWSTQDGKYKGRNFWINPESVAFQTGESTNEFTIHPIRKVKTRERADTMFVTVDYETEGQLATLSLTYLEAPGPEIRLTNQPSIRWARVGEAPAMSQ